jgi:acyl-CoA thioesterase FadM
MHMIFRTIFIFMRRKFLKPSHYNETTELTMRVLPTDLDLLWHVNNGIYFSLMDFGRFDMVFRNGVFDTTRRKGWYTVVAGETIKFRRSLKLWDKFTLQTQIIGHNEKHFFIQQKFICRGELMATGLVKVRFLKFKGGTVSTAEVLQELNVSFDNKAEELGKEWHAMETKYFA